MADTASLEELRREAMRRLEGFDGLIVPTAPFHPTLADVAADPVGVNSRMGTYTNFCNLFDLSAVAVPTGNVTDDQGTSQFGLTVVARTFEDGVAVDIARRIQITPEYPELFPAGAAGTKSSAPKVPWPVTAGAAVLPLVVGGAHRKGQPLVADLERRGAFWDGPVTTAPCAEWSHLTRLPRSPDFVRSKRGAELVGERWLLSEAALGSFLSNLPEPMLLGSITLSDGSKAVGFACDAEAAASGGTSRNTATGLWPCELLTNMSSRSDRWPKVDPGSGGKSDRPSSPACKEAKNSMVRLGASPQTLHQLHQRSYFSR
ncbi:hypothetical protein [Arthrobacter sp. MI7-26]|uniref:allophanate hydrolase-related protein n=1 Tax=Arthrobacter sp. MI7-26 TaxID=2993653 RepID=UPI0022497ADB|nr:hypothetical protein [Arthrobacter sp. MI7-26]